MTLILILFIIFILLLKSTKRVKIITNTLDHSLQTGAIAIIVANNKQLLALEKEIKIQHKAKVKAPEELLGQLLHQ